MPASEKIPFGPLRAFPRLKPGQQVALISPSSHQGRPEPGLLPQAVDILTGWGLQVAPLPQPEPRHLYLAGDDAWRAAQFQDAYLDPALAALFIARGGYGASRMLPLLQADKLAQAAPKAVVGFSDATALFAYLHSQVGVQTLHGPCLAAPGALESPQREQSLQALRQVLFAPEHRPTYVLQRLGGTWPTQPATEVEGRLLGGCLSVFQTTLGTPWEPDTQGAILFLEDVGEAPYRVDRMLTHLAQAGKFRGLKALVLGHLARCDSEPPGLLEQVLRDVLGQRPFPVAWQLAAGHGDPNLALPLGGMARLRLEAGSQGVLEII